MENEKNTVKIKIVGVGGGGTNAVERMLEAHITMVEYVTINTDDRGVIKSHAGTKIQIGKKETKGRGAGSIPSVGFNSANESIMEIMDAVTGADMIFLTAGMGGGTGTGAAPVVAKIAKKLGILTVAVVTKPFAFEGKKRMDNALSGIAELEQYADAVVVVPNDNLKKVSESRITLANAFEIADNVLMSTVKNLVEVIHNTAYINCDFSDIHRIISGSTYMYTASGVAKGENRADKVLSQISESRLLESSIDGADGVLLCITASKDAGLEEIDKIVSALSERFSDDATVIFGMNFDESFDGEMKVVLVATGKKNLQV